MSRRNGESLSAAITWEVCYACNRPTNSTSVTLGAGSFPNASFDEIGIWLELLETQTFVEIYDTYKGKYVWVSFFAATRGVPKKVLYGEAPPRALTPYPFIYHFDRNCTPFVYFLMKKGTPFKYLKDIV